MKDLMYENLLLDLLDDKIISDKVLSERVKTADYRVSHQLQVLVLELSKYQTGHRKTHFLRDSLESIFINLKSIFYKDYIVVLLDLKNNVLSENTLNKLRELLQSNNLQAGFSSEFSNLLGLSKHYSQGIKALEMGLALKEDDSIFFYDDFKVYHMLSLFNSKDLCKFCHPAIIKLIEFDKENKTDYYNTLSAYLLNNQYISKTADQLFIHRNTLNYRNNKIKEIIEVDLADSETVFQINLSYKIVRYLTSVIA